VLFLLSHRPRRSMRYFSPGTAKISWAESGAVRWRRQGRRRETIESLHVFDHRYHHLIYTPRTVVPDWVETEPRNELALKW
jgi:hypothetical protein